MKNMIIKIISNCDIFDRPYEDKSIEEIVSVEYESMNGFFVLTRNLKIEINVLQEQFVWNQLNYSLFDANNVSLF